MAVNIAGEGALEWDAVLTVDGFINGEKIINKSLENIGVQAAASAKVTAEAFAQTALVQTGLAKSADREAEMVFNAWKTRSTEIVRLAKEAGTKAGESFEFKNPTIDGIESTTLISSEQLKQMQTALTILDGTLTIQQQIAQTGLSELEYLATKKQLLEALGQQLDAGSLAQIEALKQQRQLERDIIDAKRETSSGVISQRARPKVDSVIGDEFKGILKEAGTAFDDLDQQTQQFIQNLIEVELKLAEVAGAQKALDNARQDGKISLQQYTETSAQLAAQQKSLSNDVDIITQGQKDYEAALSRTVGSIEDKKAALLSLKTAYGQLNAAERAGPEGVSLDQKIKSLKLEIKGLEPGKIEVTKTAVVSVETELRKLKNLMAANPDSPMFKKWEKQAGELKESIKSAKLSIDQATNSTAGIEAFASGLRGIVGGFTAATGIIGLFTEDTAEVEKVTKNAASALALLNGVQEISNVLQKTGALNVFLLGLARKAQLADTAAATVATEVNTVASGTNAAATGVQTAATASATVATRSLTVAMLANPAAILVAAIAALAATYLLLRNNTLQAKTASDLLTEANKKQNNTYAEKMAVLGPLVELVKQGNLTEEESIKIHEQLIAIDAKVFESLDRKKITYAALSAKVNEYTEALRGQFRIEANKEALTESFKNEQKIQEGITKTTKLLEKQNAAKATDETGVTSANVGALNGQLVEQNKNLAEQQKVSLQLVGSGAELEKQRLASDKSTQSRLQQIDAEIARLEKQRIAQGNSNADYVRNTNLIKEQEALRKQITGESKQEIKAAIASESKAQREYNKLLEDQKNLLELITGLKRDALQSGMTKELSELDKINEKYDAALIKIAEFNKKAPKNLQIDTAEVNQARATELENQVFKNQAKEYKISLDQQQKAFEEYEDFKAEYGKEKANELFAAQTKGSSSYLQYLKDQKAEIEGNVSVGPSPKLNNGQILKVQDLTKRIEAEEAKARANAFAKQVEDYKKLLQAAILYNEQRAAINKKFDELEKAALADKSGGVDQQVIRLKILDVGRKKELQGVEDLALQESALYEQMNQDILGFTNKRIKEEIASIRKAIAAKSTTDVEGNVIAIPPKFLAQLQEYIKTLEEAANKQRELFGATGAEFLEAGNFAKSLGSDIGNLAEAIRPFNEELANSVEALSSMANIAGDALSAVGSFVAGDIAGGITSAVKVLTGILQTFASTKESKRKAEQAVLDFQARIIAGELEINRIQAERERQVVRLNKLKIDGLKEELALLQKQRALNQLSFQDVLTQIQNESFVSGESTKKKKKKFGALGLVGAALGFGSTSSVVQQFSSLSGKNYEDLEALFLKGQLSGKAKELFEQLQKIKETGVDINQALADNKLEAQQLYTGTNADSILDSIVQGFADGKRATADFADDFEKLMKQSVLNALKYQALEKPLKKFYEDFAAAAESDGVLTAAEIAQLQAAYNATITAAGAQFDQLKKITDLNFSNNGGNGNSLQGAIKGITQQQADLLAGQFGGLRLTAFEQLTVARNQLNALNEIVNNTSLLIQCEAYLRYFRTTGIKVI